MPPRPKSVTTWCLSWEGQDITEILLQSSLRLTLLCRSGRQVREGSEAAGGSRRTPNPWVELGAAAMVAPA